MQLKAIAIIALKLLIHKRIKLIVDGSLMPVASLNRARTQRIRRLAGRQFWGKRKRKLYSKDYGKEVEFEEVRYGVLVLVVCDTEGTVYDLWYHPASYHEVKSLRRRVSKSVWLRWLLSRFELIIGDRGYRGCDCLRVCESKEDRAHRQVVEDVFSWLKRFNFVGGWRKGITLLTYLYAYAVVYSFYRNIKVQLCV